MPCCFFLFLWRRQSKSLPCQLYSLQTPTSFKLLLDIFPPSHRDNASSDCPKLPFCSHSSAQRDHWEVFHALTLPLMHFHGWECSFFAVSGLLWKTLASSPRAVGHGYEGEVSRLPPLPLVSLSDHLSCCGNWWCLVESVHLTSAFSPHCAEQHCMLSSFLWCLRL